MLFLCFLLKYSTCLKSRREFGELKRKMTEGPPLSVFGNKMLYRFFFYKVKGYYYIFKKHISFQNHPEIPSKSHLGQTFDQALLVLYKIARGQPRS